MGCCPWDHTESDLTEATAAAAAADFLTFTKVTASCQCTVEGSLEGVSEAGIVMYPRPMIPLLTSYCFASVNFSVSVVLEGCHLTIRICM